MIVGQMIVCRAKFIGTTWISVGEKFSESKIQL